MKRWTRILAAAVVCLARAAWTARFLWQRTTAEAVQRLRLDAGSGAPDSPDLLTGLPAPAARYFEFARTPGQRRVRAARPGFVWDAGIRTLPLVPVLVRNSDWPGQGDAGRQRSAGVAELEFGQPAQARRVSALPHRDGNGKAVLTPWAGGFGRYERISGMMVPAEVEVARVLDGRPVSYWRGGWAEYQF